MLLPISEGDSRKRMPRFSGDNLEINQQGLQPFFDLAQSKGCTPAQLALAWVQMSNID
jgi:aryl-alcohol dehydrogenase-like predicted oxidoreductase